MLLLLLAHGVLCAINSCMRYARSDQINYTHMSNKKNYIQFIFADIKIFFMPSKKRLGNDDDDESATIWKCNVMKPRKKMDI